MQIWGVDVDLSLDADLSLSYVILFFKGDDPTALSVLSQVINGQRFFNDDKVCTTCGEIKAEKKCSACKMVNSVTN